MICHTHPPMSGIQCLIFYTRRSLFLPSSSSISRWNGPRIQTYLPVLASSMQLWASHVHILSSTWPGATILLQQETLMTNGYLTHTIQAEAEAVPLILTSIDDLFTSLGGSPACPKPSNLSHLTVSKPSWWQLVVDCCLRARNKL